MTISSSFSSLVLHMLFPILYYLKNLIILVIFSIWAFNNLYFFCIIIKRSIIIVLFLGTIPILVFLIWITPFNRKSIQIILMFVIITYLTMKFARIFFLWIRTLNKILSLMVVVLVLRRSCVNYFSYFLGFFSMLIIM